MDQIRWVIIRYLQKQYNVFQVLTAMEYTTSIRNQAVKLRKEEHGLGSEDPISVPTLLQEVSEAHPDVVAMKGCDKISGQWTSWTYQQLQADVTVLAKAMIETGLHRHHSVAVIGYNYPHWVISNMAAISAGLVLLLLLTTTHHPSYL